MRKMTGCSETEPKSVKLATPRAQALTLFGPRTLVAGEAELRARVYTAVNPVNAIDDILLNDVVCAESDILRWRRARNKMIAENMRSPLENVLRGQIKSPMTLEELAAALVQERGLEPNRADEVARVYLREA